MIVSSCSSCFASSSYYYYYYNNNNNNNHRYYVNCIPSTFLKSPAASRLLLLPQPPSLPLVALLPHHLFYLSNGHISLSSYEITTAATTATTATTTTTSNNSDKNHPYVHNG